MMVVVKMVWRCDDTVGRDDIGGGGGDDGGG